MQNHRRKALSIVMGLIVIFLAGCGNNEFYTIYDKFTDSYLIATDFINADNDTLKVIKKMDPDLVETKLKEMKNYIDAMNKKLNSDDDNEFLINATAYYNELNSMLYYYRYYEKLTLDERLDASTEVIIIIMHREDILKYKEL